MKKIIFILLIAGAWYVNEHGWPDFIKNSSNPIITNSSLFSTPPTAPAAFKPQTNSPAAATFRCDGRTHCSQMRSCAEATYFLRNCPNTKMDGDRNGIPCEIQWCHR